MKHIARTAYCLMALIALLLCLPLMAQSNDESNKTEEPAKNDEVITTSSMEELLQEVESDGTVITTTKMKKRLEDTPEGSTIITNTTLGEEPTAAAPGAFTNKHLGTEDDGDAAAGDAAVEAETAAGGDADADADAEPNEELDRLIGEIEAELDDLAARVQGLEGDSSEARLRETEARIEELRKAVDALKQSD